MTELWEGGLRDVRRAIEHPDLQRAIELTAGIRIFDPTAPRDTDS
jgi:hypothetical protein